MKISLFAQFELGIFMLHRLATILAKNRIFLALMRAEQDRFEEAVFPL